MRLLEGKLIFEGGRFVVEGSPGVSGDLTQVLQSLVGRNVRISAMEILDGEDLLPDGFDQNGSPLIDVRVPLGLSFSSNDNPSRDDD
jgi:hypothetical protein